MNAVLNALYFCNKCTEQQSTLLCSFMMTVDDTEDVSKLVNDNVGDVTAHGLLNDSIIKELINCSSVTQAAARCLGSSLLGPFGNRRAALITLRSGTVLPSMSNSPRGLWPATYDTDTACTHETMSIARIVGLTTIGWKSQCG